jgi:hypothetical protein
MSGNSRTREKECISAVIKLLRRVDFPNIPEPQWIDGHEIGDGLPEAVAEPFVIEHFTVDALPQQRRNGAWFSEVVSPIEAEYADRLGFRLVIEFAEDAIAHRNLCEGVRASFRAWVGGPAQELPEGFHKDLKIDGVPFSVLVWKNGPISSNGIIFKRISDGAVGLEERLEDKYQNKMRKLSAHAHRAKRGLLLVESEGDHLMSSHTFLATFKKMAPEHSFDDVAVWFVQTESHNQFFALDVATGRVFLADTSSGAVVGETWICV